jgi:predicted glycosyltransferase
MKHSPYHVFFVVESLVGSGHLNVVDNLSKELIDHGLGVTIATGSRFTKGRDIHFPDEATVIDLPASMAGSLEMNCSVDLNTGKKGKPVMEDLSWQRRYYTLLLESFLHVAQSEKKLLLAFEFFPLGRGEYSNVYLPLIQAAKKLSIPIVSICRDYTPCPGMLLLDIPYGSSDQTAVDLILDSFDAVYIRGPEILAELFSKGFPLSKAIEKKSSYIGYILKKQIKDMPLDSLLKDNVLITCGGSWVNAFPEKGFFSILKAREKVQERVRSKVWRFLFPWDTPERFLSLFKKEVEQYDSSGHFIVVEHNRKDFTQILSQSAILISRGGYNSVTEGLAVGVPMLVVPLIGETGDVKKVRGIEGDTYVYTGKGVMPEQFARAQAFYKSGWLDLLIPDEMNDVEYIAGQINSTFDRKETIKALPAKTFCGREKFREEVCSLMKRHYGD